MEHVCPTCDTPHDGTNRYCPPCFAAYMRSWRASEPSRQVRERFTSRVRYLVRCGRLQRGPCRDCGVAHEDSPVTPWGPDPDRPVWLCAGCLTEPPSIAHVDASPGGETTELGAGPAGGL